MRPGEKPPVLPAVAKTRTREGATFFAVHYFRALDWAIATNDPTPLVGLAEPSCKTCAGFVSTITKLVEFDRHTVGGRISVFEFGPIQATYRIHTDAFVDIKVEQGRSRVLSASGAVTATEPGGNSEFIVALAWRTSRWVVVGIDKQ